MQAVRSWHDEHGDRQPHLCPCDPDVDADPESDSVVLGNAHAVADAEFHADSDTDEDGDGPASGGAGGGGDAGGAPADGIALLVSRGWGAAWAECALAMCDGDVEAAAAFVESNSEDMEELAAAWRLSLGGAGAGLWAGM